MERTAGPPHEPYNKGWYLCHSNCGPTRSQSDYLDVLSTSWFQSWEPKVYGAVDTVGSVDDWKGTLSCAVLGSFSVSDDSSQHDGSGPCPTLPDAFSFKSATTVVQPVNLQELFENDSIDSLYQFTSTDHITEFDKESVMDMLGDPISGDAIDSSLVIFDKVWKAFMFIPHLPGEGC